MKPHTRLLCACASALHMMLAAGNALAVQHIEAYNTYLYPPFVQDGDGGIANVLVAYLNQRLAGDFHFTLVNLPRKRFVIMHLEAQQALRGIGLLLAPEFVGDTDRKQYLWSHTLFNDHNLLVFRKGELPANTNEVALRGKRFIGVSGNNYAHYDALASSGMIRKFENNSEQSNLHMLQAGRADFTQMNAMLFNTLVNMPGSANQFETMPDPALPSFVRRIMVPREYAALLPKINAAIDRLPCYAAWRAMAKRYQIKLPDCIS